MTNPNTGVNETCPLYFDFEQRYEEYLCPERSDAFVMGLLSSAMETGCDIEFETPMTDRLFYQMNDDYLPMMAKYHANFPLYDIRLLGPAISAKLLIGGQRSSNGLLMRSRLTLHDLRKDLLQR